MKDKIFLRGHHLSNLADYCLNEDSIAEFVHGDEIMDLYDRFRDNPELSVELVDGLDSICEAAGVEECPDFSTDCVFPDWQWDEDRETLKEYRFKVGETYCVSDVLERMIDYQTETGFISPRIKFSKQNKKSEVEK